MRKDRDSYTPCACISGGPPIHRFGDKLFCMATEPVVPKDVKHDVMHMLTQYQYPKKEQDECKFGSCIFPYERGEERHEQDCPLVLTWPELYNRQEEPNSEEYIKLFGDETHVYFVPVDKSTRVTPN